jgi:diguanylate cyclase (GGDEF)-like protein
MKSVLKMTLLVQPDRQRLAAFAIDAVQALGGSVFNAAASLTHALPALQSRLSQDADPVPVELVLDQQQLLLCWENRREVLSPLPHEPPDTDIAQLTERLSQESESADPELLRRRNARISTELERAKARAAAEMAELEALLEHKKAELQESLRAAETDGLTGLLNRGAYDVRLRAAVQRCQRQGEPLCLLLLDLDNFKAVNDMHGHQYGDTYLQRMAEAMRGAVRLVVDHVCRIGGDEFAIVLFADLPAAERVAGKVLEKMDGKVSIGIARLRPQDDTPSLVARADRALYRAKRQGRGRYIIATDPGRRRQGCVA